MAPVLGCALAIILLMAAVAARADEPAAFVLHTAAGKDHTGILKQVGPRWSVVLLDGEDYTRAAGDEVVSLRRAKTPLPAPPSGEHLVLANGDLLPGTTVELIGESLRFRADTGVPLELKLPLSAVSVIWVAAPDGTEHPDRLRRELAGGKRSRDLVYLRNGDVVAGVLAALDRKKLEIEVDKKDVTLEFAKVAAIALNTDLVRLSSPREPYARVVLANGGRLSLAAAPCDGRLVTGKAVFGGAVRIPVASLVALDLRQGPAEYLSDRKPAKVEYRSFLGSLQWPFVADGNVWKGDLRLAGSTYDKGLGTHAEARLTYALGAGFQRFEALVGLDDRSGANAAARVRVLVDGKAADLGVPADLTRKGGPRSLAVDIRGAKELTLVVEFPARVGPVPGDVNWADARLIRAAAR